VKKKITTRNLPVALTDDEIRKAGDALAMACEDITSEEARAKEIKDDLKNRMSSLEAERNRLAVLVRRKEEYRQVEVDIWFDYQRGMVEEIRTDTGEQIKIRPMTDDERQQGLPMDEPE